MFQSIIIILGIAAGSWILLAVLASLTFKLPGQLRIAIGTGAGMGVGFLLTFGGLPAPIGSISDLAIIINCVIAFISLRNHTMIGMAIGLLIPVLIRGWD